MQTGRGKVKEEEKDIIDKNLQLAMQK